MNLVQESTYTPDPGYASFHVMVYGHDPAFVKRVRQPHPDFPVSAKLGSPTNKEND
jgi:hypothetical protein